MFEDKMDEQRKDIRQIVGEFVRNLKHGKRCDFVRYAANEKHESFDKWTRRLAAWSEGMEADFVQLGGPQLAAG